MTGERVFLHAENPSSLGDDTFWTWFKREFPQSRWDWENATSNDVVLQYSALGAYRGPAKYIALCWELYPDMHVSLPPEHGDYTKQLARCFECARETPYRTVPTLATKHYYEQFGDVAVIPIGVDTDLFKPLGRKDELREKHALPGGHIGFWCGTPHHMKGYDLLTPDTHMVCVWKDKPAPKLLPNSTSFGLRSQVELNELMNCCDFVALTGRLKPMFLVEWEAIAAGLPVVIIPGSAERELIATSRQDLIAAGWDRDSAKHRWVSYIEAVLAA